MTSTDSDRDLWLRSTQGDTTAFGVLFTRHASTVANYCAYRNGTFRDAEDLAATVFLELWRSRGRLEVRGTSALPLLFGVAAKICSHHRRSAGRWQRASARLRGQADQGDPADDICSRVDAQRDAAAVHRALHQLSPDQRAAVELCYLGELTLSEAAVALGVPVGTVKSRLSRARSVLLETLPQPATTTAREPS